MEKEGGAEADWSEVERLFDEAIRTKAGWGYLNNVIPDNGTRTFVLSTDPTDITHQAAKAVGVYVAKYLLFQQN
ncbi:hypothetical protein COV89_03945 [Candidatus Shapirobacteria bacterium CG11_big_fil_rev_8_21_14_0_20_40_12]|uniref:Uncharacterized protein n=2 Tax=Candidatus Shapironibacteriota TaxID=1752721 RepID=A0A2M8EV93_9BACT|nr:MAG: hypothetical protein COV89_03945 [Candidatus Shapirobacteria bacterium CG11_big_fil_rev_8_21_14_0_20_40_12]PJC29032.1 MAG: hypothetical protein CO053_01505 [Candidatus Shapirobacteria bacterium CG_4_9_14_0_2_um_filter_40_11]